jgi:hypothetical protein
MYLLQIPRWLKMLKQFCIKVPSNNDVKVLGGRGWRILWWQLSAIIESLTDYWRGGRSKNCVTSFIYDPKVSIIWPELNLIKLLGAKLSQVSKLKEPKRFIGLCPEKVDFILQKCHIDFKRSLKSFSSSYINLP